MAAAIALTAAFASRAAVPTLAEAKQMYLDGDYASALPAFEKALAAKPRDGSLNHWVGVCLMYTGDADRAVAYLKKAQARKVTESPRYLAEIAFRKYDFDAAEEYLDEYEAALRKAKRSMPAEVAELQRQISLAKPMFDGVEKIQIIDSVAVARDDFFRIYRLSPESGTLAGEEELPEGVEAADPAVVYMPQSRQLMIWAAPDSAENYVLMQSAQMIGGKWERPHRLAESLENGGDSNYPFLMSDGVTLYFANNGEGSIGGYDIFLTRRDDENGFLQPQNIGMPYNSPYDDYMLAIDEINGVGWWATDRNQLGDSITVYKFIPSELRVNYSTDESRLASLAKVERIRDTWPTPDADYSEVLSRIANIQTEKSVAKPDFQFAMPGGRIYRYWDDFDSPRARDMMEQYLDAKDAMEVDQIRLAALRKRYHDGDTRVTDDILALERQMETHRAGLRKLRNDVVRAEQQR